VAPRPASYALLRACAGAAAFAAVLAACAEPVSAPAAPAGVVGLGYAAFITAQDVGRLQSTSEVLAVVQCARVAIIRTATSDADLRALPNVIDTGPVLLGPDSLTVEAEVDFSSGALRDADILGIRQIGRIEAIEGALHRIWIFAQAGDLARLDRLPHVVSCGIVRQNPLPAPSCASCT
jgi:hypothetical protein